jgi:glycosyltransferase involved in cell wall biosynthesis
VGRFGHPFFREQLRCAPDGFVYSDPESSSQGQSGAGASVPRRIALQGARARRARTAVERLAIGGLASAGHIRRVAAPRPPNCALIHSAQQLLRAPSLPYVLDFECVEVFSLYQRVALRRARARGSLLEALADERCRFLLPWSLAAERGLGAALGARAAERLGAKTVTVPPAIRARADRPSSRGTGPLRVLFVGTAFAAKGGVEAIRAVAQVRASHDVTLDLVSDVPERWGRLTEELDGVTLHPWPAPSTTVQDLFQHAEVLLFPSHMDTLGFVMLEAMAHGMPVLATRHFATPELVEDGVSGLLVEGENLLYGEDGMCRFDRTLPPPRSFRRALSSPSEEYVTRIADALARLAEEGDLYERLAVGALARVLDGPLSVARRREALGRVYRQALEC